MRELLVETELGRIAQGAQIVIHIQDDAKQMLRDAINKEYRKKEFETDTVYQDGFQQQNYQDQQLQSPVMNTDNPQITFSSERFIESKALESLQ